MSKFKTLIIIGAVIALTAILTLIYIVAFKNPSSNQGSNAEQFVQGIDYRNEEFGFSLTLPESWEGYQVSQSEHSIMFYIPADGQYKNVGYKYGPIIYVTAIPMSEAIEQEALCKTPDPNRYWAECAAVTESIGENNAYKFYTRFADDYMEGHEDEGKAVQKSIKFFDIEENPKLRTFRSINKDLIYEFEYPTNTFAAEYGENIYIPYNYDKMSYSQITLFHQIPVQYCGASGQCTPNTIDMKFGAVLLEDSITDIQRSNIGDQLKARTFGTNTTLILSQGAEGEGIEYYFIEMPNQKVLMLYHKYINENVVLNYKKEKDFIPYAKQVEIAENIVQSVKFTN